MINTIFLQISILFAVTAVVAFIIRFLRQPLLVAYIIAGIITGPLLLNIVHGKEASYHVFSEFGIVLLLFGVGLSLNFSHIKKIGRTSAIIGLSQVGLTTLIGTSLLLLFHLPLISAVALAVAMSFSSTIIITKLLTDKKDTESVYGRYTIGHMLIQDIMAIGILLFLATLNEGSGSLGSAIGLLALKAGILIACIYFLAKFLLPFLLDRIAKSSEFLFLFTLAWCFGIAGLVHVMGFSLEIGAIMAGVSLGSSPYQPEIASRIKPLRDFFLILFFVILGSEVHFASLGSVILPAAAITLIILFVTPACLYLILRQLKFTRRNSFLVGSTASQVSEFGFVLLFAGTALGYVGESELVIFTLVALATIFVSSYIITYNESLYRRLIPFFAFFGRDKLQQPEDEVQVYDAWVIGYHRMGWKVCETLARKKVSFAVIDFNPETVKLLHAKGIPVYFGDVADVEFLSAIPIEQSKLIVSTIPEIDDQRTLINYVRSHSKKPYIIANAGETTYVESLYEAGVDYIMMPHMLGGYRLAEILRSKSFSRPFFRKLRREQEEEMAMRFSAETND